MRVQWKSTNQSKQFLFALNRFLICGRSLSFVSLHFQHCYYSLPYSSIKQQSQFVSLLFGRLSYRTRQRALWSSSRFTLFWNVFFCPSLRLSDCLSFNWAFICLPIDAKWGSACMMSLLCYFTLLLLIYTCLSINAFFVGESSGFSDGSLFNFSCSFSVLANALYCWLFFITKIVHNFKLA